MHIKKYYECNKCMLINRLENLECKLCTNIYCQLEVEYEWTCTNCDLKNHPYDFICLRCDKKKSSTCMLTEAVFIITEVEKQVTFKVIIVTKNSQFRKCFGIGLSDLIKIPDFTMVFDNLLLSERFALILCACQLGAT
jgi:hypothetical protein